MLHSLLFTAKKSVIYSQTLKCYFRLPRSDFFLMRDVATDSSNKLSVQPSYLHNLKALIWEFYLKNI